MMMKVDLYRPNIFYFIIINYLSFELVILKFFIFLEIIFLHSIKKL